MIRSRAAQSPPSLDEIIRSMRAAQSQPQPESLTSVLHNLRRQESITAPFSSNPLSQSVVWPRPDQPGTLIRGRSSTTPTTLTSASLFQSLMAPSSTDTFIRGHSSTTQTTATFPFTPSSFTKNVDFKVQK